MDSDRKTSIDAGQPTAEKGGATIKRTRDDFPSAAQRALLEAEQRRGQHLAEKEATREIGGRGGKDPARYGDWEVKGIAVDF